VSPVTLFPSELWFVFLAAQEYPDLISQFPFAQRSLATTTRILAGSKSDEVVADCIESFNY